MNFANLFEASNNENIAKKLNLNKRKPAYMALLRSKPGASPYPQFKTKDDELLTVVPGSQVHTFNEEGEENFTEEFQQMIEEGPVAILPIGYEEDEDIGRTLEKLQQNDKLIPSSPKASFAKEEWGQPDLVDPSKSKAVSQIALQWTDHQVEKLQAKIDATVSMLGVFALKGEKNFTLVNHEGETKTNRVPEEYSQYFTDRSNLNKD